MPEHRELKKSRVSGGTALVLSGGASRGAYEIGAWQALRELGVEIDMVCGTSIGAMNAYVVACGEYEKARAMWEDMRTERVFRFDGPAPIGGSFADIKEDLSSDFPEEAARASGVGFGLCTVKLLEDGSPDLSRIEPLYMWKEDIPEGKMLDYVLASCACFPVVKPYDIDGSKYLDGAFYDAMPIGMALERGAERIIAVDLEAVGIVRKKDIEEAGDRLTLIQPFRSLGNGVVFDPDNTRRIMRLGYLDALKKFGAFEGRLYTFIKGDMDRRTLPAAERAGDILGLDPGLIYSAERYAESLRKAVESYRDISAYEAVEAEYAKIKAAGFSLKDIMKTASGAGDYSRQAIFLFACGLLGKQEAGSLKSAAIKIGLGKDYAAAVWMVKNGMV